MCTEGVVKYFYEDSGSSEGAGIAGQEDSGWEGMEEASGPLAMLPQCWPSVMVTRGLLCDQPKLYFSILYIFQYMGNVSPLYICWFFFYSRLIVLKWYAVPIKVCKSLFLNIFFLWALLRTPCSLKYVPWVAAFGLTGVTAMRAKSRMPPSPTHTDMRDGREMGMMGSFWSPLSKSESRTILRASFSLTAHIPTAIRSKP